MTINVNRYWLVNLFNAIDGETIEVTNDVNKYLNIDYSKEDNIKLLVEEFLRPQFLFFNNVNQHKIKTTYRYALQNLNESEIEKVIDYYGGIIVNPSHNNMTYKELCFVIWNQLFENEPSQFTEAVIDVNDSKNIALKDNGID